MQTKENTSKLMQKLYKIASVLRISRHADSIQSYAENQMLKEQGVDWSSYSEYQRIRAIHSILEIYEADNLDNRKCRVGRDQDGGYVMMEPLSSCRIAYSFGISNEVSWDLDMAERGYDVYQYDHTIHRLPQKNERFHWEKKGIAANGKEQANLHSLASILQENGHSEKSGMVLKMDVEGAEWDVLCTVEPDVLTRFDQIVLELHDVLDKRYRDRNERALKKLTQNHAVIHIHGNNYDSVNYCEKYITPNMLEVTLVNRKTYSLRATKDCFFPTDLDRPCNPKMQDIRIGSWN